MLCQLHINSTELQKQNHEKSAGMSLWHTHKNQVCIDHKGSHEQSKSFIIQEKNTYLEDTCIYIPQVINALWKFSTTKNPFPQYMLSFYSVFVMLFNSSYTSKNSPLAIFWILYFSYTSVRKNIMHYLVQIIRYFFFI